MARHLDRAVDLAFPRLPAPCHACGAPNPALGAVLVLRPWDRIVQCAACGRDVTESGVSPIRADERQGLAIIRLTRDPPSGLWLAPDAG